MGGISASIVVLAGAICLSAGALAGDADKGLLAMYAGAALGLAGLFVWARALNLAGPYHWFQTANRPEEPSSHPANRSRDQL